LGIFTWNFSVAAFYEMLLRRRTNLVQPLNANALSLGLLFFSAFALQYGSAHRFESTSTTEESFLILGRDSHRNRVSNSPNAQPQENLTNLTNEVLEATLYTNTSSTSRADNGRSLDSMTNLFSRFSKALDLGKVVREIETSVMSSVSCTACRAGVGLLLHYVHSGRTNQEIAHAATKLCINLKMQSPRVCTGIINIYIDEAVEVLRQVVLDSNEICGSVVGEACGSGNISPSLEWSVTFPPVPKPPVVQYIGPESKVGGKPTPTLKILQISDTHWDPWYEPGANAECNEPLCCRISSGPPPPPQSRKGAGIWGDYRKCDTPRVTIESMLGHIRDAHPDIDYIIWTGDIPAHDVWNQTHSSNINVIKDTVDLMLQYFPHTPIFPALGNHEGAPVNSFAPPWVTNPEFSIDWLYTFLQKEWARWLPATTQRTIGQGAYYSTILKPGFKLISLNMNYCNNKNWWLLINGTDPTDELKWLIFELQSSEFAEEKVHIIGHIPPGHSDCLAVWSKNYYKIISRYESTITAQFFGHTHFDEMELFYSLEDPWRPSSIAYVAPSVTPYYDVNPGYRIYTVDGDYKGSTRAVLDHETWVTDLGEANRLRSPELTWYKLYTAKEAYNLKDLSPSSWEDLVMSMYKNKRLFNMYYRFYNKNSPVAPPCDEECTTRLLCDIRSGRSHAREQLCKPRPPNTRTFRDPISAANEKPPTSSHPGMVTRIFGMLSSAKPQEVYYYQDEDLDFGSTTKDDKNKNELNDENTQDNTIWKFVPLN